MENNQYTEENKIFIHHPDVAPSQITETEETPKQSKKKLDIKSGNILTFLKIK